MQRGSSALSLLSRQVVSSLAQRQLTRPIHTSMPPQAPLPVWMHSLVGNQAAIRARFQQNRETLLSQFPPSAVFNPVHELLKVAHCDQDQERIQKALELIHAHPQLQPIVAAAAVIAKNTNFKLLYLGALTYSKDYLGSFFKGALTESFYSVKQNALVIKRKSNHKELTRMLAASLVQLVGHTLSPVGPEPNIADLRLSSAVERANVYMPQEKKRDLTYLQDKVEEIAGQFSREALEKKSHEINIWNHEFLHKALLADFMSQKEIPERNLNIKRMRALMLAPVTWPDGPVAPPKPLQLKAQLLSMLVTAEAGLVEQYFPHTLEVMAANTIEAAARFVVKEEIAPDMIRGIAHSLQTTVSIELTVDDKNKIEELLNHYDLLTCIYHPALSADANLENQTAIFDAIVKHVTENKKVDKEKLLQEISVIADKIDQNNTLRIRPR